MSTKGLTVAKSSGMLHEVVSYLFRMSSVSELTGIMAWSKNEEKQADVPCK